MSPPEQNWHAQLSFLLTVFLVAAVLPMHGCTIVPLKGGNTISQHFPAPKEVRIAQRLRREGPALPTNAPSAARLQASGYQAWQDRQRLTQLADISLDIQYFTWKDDDSGRVLMSHVIDAADRGVRVRLLLDDMMAVQQTMLSRIDAHKNIEVRLFNPFSTQRVDTLIRPFEWLTKERVNVRMHNKVFIADGLVGIVGGRNIENRYFWIDPEFNHRDLDAVVIGAVIPELQHSFDDYWNSPWAVPMALLESPSKPRKARKYYQALREYRANKDVVTLFAPIPAVALKDYRISEGMVAARIEFIADDPDKVVSRQPSQFNYLDNLIDENVEERLLIGMAYVVPTEAVMAQVTRTAKRGVAISILTNSLVSIDFPAAFSGYAVMRKQLVPMGVDLFEFAADASYSECPVSCKGVHMGYHSKLIVLDQRISYIGSMNYDPRSININTEAGLIFYSEELSAQIAALFHQDAGTRNSWHVSHASPLQWSRPYPHGGPQTLNHEPDAGVLNKIGVVFWGLMPWADQY
jgi:putative cardiolipin synthase